MSPSSSSINTAMAGTEATTVATLQETMASKLALGDIKGWLACDDSGSGMKHVWDNRFVLRTMGLYEHALILAVQCGTWHRRANRRVMFDFGSRPALRLAGDPLPQETDSPCIAALPVRGATDWCGATPGLRQICCPAVRPALRRAEAAALRGGDRRASRPHVHRPKFSRWSPRRGCQHPRKGDDRSPPESTACEAHPLRAAAAGHHSDVQWRVWVRMWRAAR